jgi:hypothetical protein
MHPLRGLLVASGLAALLLTAGLVGSPPAARAQSSMPGCIAPCDAANIYLSQLGYLQGQLSSNPGRCRAQCGEIRKGCVNAVVASERCFRGTASAILGFDFLGCSDLSSSDKAQCNKDISSQNYTIEGFLQDNVQCGKGDCESAFQDCLLSCNAPE